MSQELNQRKGSLEQVITSKIKNLQEMEMTKTQLENQIRILTNEIFSLQGKIDLLAEMLKETGLEAKKAPEKKP